MQVSGAILGILGIKEIGGGQVDMIQNLGESPTLFGLLEGQLGYPEHACGSLKGALKTGLRHQKAGVSMWVRWWISRYCQEKTDQPSQNSQESCSAYQPPELFAQGSTGSIGWISTRCNRIINTVHTCKHLNLSALNPTNTSKSRLSSHFT